MPKDNSKLRRELEKGSYVDQQAETVRAGDLAVTIQFDSGDRPLDVQVMLGNVPLFDKPISGEVLERIAKIIENRRDARTKYSSAPIECVCPRHGYERNVSPRRYGDNDCATCALERKRLDEEEACATEESARTDAATNRTDPTEEPTATVDLPF